MFSSRIFTIATALSCSLLPLSDALAQENLRIGRSAPLSYTRQVGPADEPILDSDQFQSIPEVQINSHSGPTTVRINSQPSNRPRSSVLTAQDVAVLRTRDVVLLIDKSGSMETRDCPAPNPGLLPFILRGQVGTEGNLSRWDWCRLETARLSEQTAGIFQKGIAIVPFDSRYNVYPNVRLSEVGRVFSENHPGGSTNIASALSAALGNYFERREQAPQKPIVIAVISDGVPNSMRSVRDTIKKATRALRNQTEIKITFLHVGNDRNGLEFLKDLDDDLVSDGATADIVDTKRFAELLQTGLARALVDAISERSERN